MTAIVYVSTRRIRRLQAMSINAAAVLFAVAFATNALADQLRGQVVAVADGDTVTVLDTERHQHRVRLMGIDAPEKRQAFGRRSRENLASLVLQQDVEVQFDKHDRYGRIVGKVLISGSDAGLSN
jgi:endonuclease YncB( thermonuclease family)